MRGADAAFVAASRIPPAGRPEKFWGPDLAVEVPSPSGTVEEIEEKVDDYLTAGTPLVWVVNPCRKAVTAYRPGGKPVILCETGTLDGGSTVPEFACVVARIFE